MWFWAHLLRLIAGGSQLIDIVSHAGSRTITV